MRNIVTYVHAYNTYSYICIDTFVHMYTYVIHWIISQRPHQPLTRFFTFLELSPYHLTLTCHKVFDSHIIDLLVMVIWNHTQKDLFEFSDSCFTSQLVWSLPQKSELSQCNPPNGPIDRKDATWKLDISCESTSWASFYLFSL